MVAATIQIVGRIQDTLDGEIVSAGWHMAGRNTIWLV